MIIDSTITFITDEEVCQDNKIQEELLAINREKTRLARFEKELLVRAQELELEARKSQLEEQLYKSLSIRGKHNCEFLYH